MGDRAALAELLRRLDGVSIDSERRWGKMNVQQMLTHLVGAMEWLLDDGETPTWPKPPSKLLKFAALRVPLPWPRGVAIPNDPAGVEVSAEEFEGLKARAAELLDRMHAWEVGASTPAHPMFGPMSTWEWHRWGYKHAHHHLTQFGA